MDTVKRIIVYTSLIFFKFHDDVIFLSAKILLKMHRRVTKHFKDMWFHFDGVTYIKDKCDYLWEKVNK
jgi:hypothetical protein